VWGREGGGAVGSKYGRRLRWLQRSALPPGAKVSREAKECVQEAVSEFVAFVTSEGASSGERRRGKRERGLEGVGEGAEGSVCAASEKCMQAKRKTVNGSDLLWALGTLGFEEYVDVLNEHLATVREPQRRARPKSS
jgi:histone H3/H4